MLHLPYLALETIGMIIWSARSISVLGPIAPPTQFAVIPAVLHQFHQRKKHLSRRRKDVHRVNLVVVPRNPVDSAGECNNILAISQVGATRDVFQQRSFHPTINVRRNSQPVGSGYHGHKLGELLRVSHPDQCVQAVTQINELRPIDVRYLSIQVDWHKTISETPSHDSPRRVPNVQHKPPSGN